MTPQPTHNPPSRWTRVNESDLALVLLEETDGSCAPAVHQPTGAFPRRQRGSHRTEFPLRVRVFRRFSLPCSSDPSWAHGSNTVASVHPKPLPLPSGPPLDHIHQGEALPTSRALRATYLHPFAEGGLSPLDPSHTRNLPLGWVYTFQTRMNRVNHVACLGL